MTRRMSGDVDAQSGEAETVRLSFEGATSLLLDVAEGPFSDVLQARIWALSETLAREEGFVEAVPGMNNLMAVFDPTILAPDRAHNRLLALWHSARADHAPGRIVDVPVAYGQGSMNDLIEFSAALGLSPEEVIRRHTAPLYSVAAVGAMPGFVYLSGLDLSLGMPRRASPRQAVPEGAVMIGGAQAGIMPITAPSGWHILGMTPLRLFDPTRDAPALFRPGDRIRFVATGDPA